MDDKSKKTSTRSTTTTTTSTKPSNPTTVSTTTVNMASTNDNEYDDDFYLNNDDDEDVIDDYDDEEDDLDPNDDDFDDYNMEEDETQPKKSAELATPAANLAATSRSVSTAINLPNNTKPAVSHVSSSLTTGACRKKEESSVAPPLSSSQRAAGYLNQSSSGGGRKRNVELDDEFKYEVLTPDKIVNHMIDCIKEVNQVLELPPTTTRILLHHFRWDKEKLMERFYDGDQDRLFKEAHIVSPFKNVASSSGATSSRKVVNIFGFIDITLGGKVVNFNFFSRGGFFESVLAHTLVSYFQKYNLYFLKCESNF